MNEVLIRSIAVAPPHATRAVTLSLSVVLDIATTIFGNWTALALLTVIGLAIAAGNLLVPGDELGPSDRPGEPGKVARDVEPMIPDGVSPGPVAIEAAVRNLRVNTRRHRAEERRLRLLRKFRPLPTGVTIKRLEEIAECESGGDPKAVSSSGLYHGKYQFHPGTWRSVGGRGLPSRAPEVEQDYRAGLLLDRSGPGQWPVCGA